MKKMQVHGRVRAVMNAVEVSRGAGNRIRELEGAFKATGIDAEDLARIEKDAVAVPADAPQIAEMGLRALGKGLFGQAQSGVLGMVERRPRVDDKEKPERLGLFGIFPLHAGLLL